MNLIVKTALVWCLLGLFSMPIAYAQETKTIESVTFGGRVRPDRQP
jgi:hypothetical protein